MKYQDDNQQLTPVQVLCQGHGALVETVSKFHPDPELDQVRHLDTTRSDLKVPL